MPTTTRTTYQHLFGKSFLRLLLCVFSFRFRDRRWNFSVSCNAPRHGAIVHFQYPRVCSDFLSITKLANFAAFAPLPCGFINTVLFYYRSIGAISNFLRTVSTGFVCQFASFEKNFGCHIYFSIIVHFPSLLHAIQLSR